MLKVNFSSKATKSLKQYSDNYLNYYEDLYSDSWIWSQDKIIDWYILESIQRYNEIVDSIEAKLGEDIVSYNDNEVIIRWRSKILLVSFKDAWDTRIITDIEIR